MARRKKKSDERLDVSKTRIALYARVSTSNQVKTHEDQMDSCDVQESRLRAAVKLRKEIHGTNQEVVGVFRDDGVSGKSLERPALKRLLAAVRAGSIDLIVVTRVDRLTRTLTDFYHFNEVLKKHGVEFQSLQENFDTTTAMGRAMLNLVLVFAQMYRETASENTRAANRRRAQDGFWVGGRTPLGYVRDKETRKLKVVPEEAELVELAFSRTLDLASALGAAKWLNESGHRQRKGNKFTHDAVLRMVQNKIYLGLVTYEGEAYAGQHEAIIPRDLFARVESVLAANDRRQYRNADDGDHDYLLTGLLQDSNGYAMTTSSATNHQGRRYPYYQSIGPRKKIGYECEVDRVPAVHLEEAVVRVIRDLAGNERAIETGVEEANQQVANRAKPLRRELRSLRNELASLTAKTDQLLDAIMDAGIETSTTARRRLGEMEARQGEIQGRLLQLQTELAAVEGYEIDVDAVRRTLVGFDAAWDHLTAAERKEVLELLIDRITVKKDEIILDLYDGRGVAVPDPEEANPRPPFTGKNRGFVSDLVWLRRRGSNSRPGG